MLVFGNINLMRFGSTSNNSSTNLLIAASTVTNAQTLNVY